MTEQREGVCGNMRGLPVGSWQRLLAVSLLSVIGKSTSVCYINIWVGREIAAAFLLFTQSEKSLKIFRQ